MADPTFESNLEQAEEGFVRCARILDAYYHALLETKLPVEMVEKLTLELQKHWLNQAFPPKKENDA